MNRYEALAEALAEVWSGANQIDAECVADHLADRGYEVVPMPAYHPPAEPQPELPLASTRGLPKQRTS